MKASHLTLLALAALMAAAGASAQLKAPVANPTATSATTGNDTEADKAAAGQLAAAGWLVLLDRRDWGRAWESTSSVFRSTVPLPAWMDAIPKARGPLGAFIERTPDEANYRSSLEGQPVGDYVTSIFKSKFAVNPNAKEVVTTVREPDGKWRVTGYSTR